VQIGKMECGQFVGKIKPDTWRHGKSTFMTGKSIVKLWAIEMIWSIWVP
jgi:hypothetical protein